MGLSVEEITQGPMGSTENDADAQRAGALFQSVPSLDDVFGVDTGVPLTDATVKAKDGAQKAEATAPEATTRGLASEGAERGVEGAPGEAATQQALADLTAEQLQAIETLSALPKEQYERFLRANPTHVLSVTTQAEASRMIRNLQRANETAAAERKVAADAAANQKAEYDRYQEYRATLKLAESTDPDLYEQAQEASAKLIRQYADLDREQEILASPQITARVAQIEESAGVQALEYYTESVREHPRFKDLGKAVFDKARATATSPGDYVSVTLDAYIAKHKLVPESELDARVQARVDDARASGYGAIRPYDLQRSEGHPTNAPQIDWTKTPEEMFERAFEIPSRTVRR